MTQSGFYYPQQKKSLSFFPAPKTTAICNCDRLHEVTVALDNFPERKTANSAAVPVVMAPQGIKHLRELRVIIEKQPSVSNQLRV
jgi:hypothetical protein